MNFFSEKIKMRVIALKRLEKERKLKRSSSFGGSSRRSSRARSMTRSVFSPTESLINGNYTPIYPQRNLNKSLIIPSVPPINNNNIGGNGSQKIQQTPLSRSRTEVSDNDNPSSMKKICNFVLKPFSDYNTNNNNNRVKSKNNSYNNLESINETSFDDRSINTGASIWQAKKHGMRSIPPRKILSSDELPLLKSNSASLMDYDNVKSVVSNLEQRLNVENKRRSNNNNNNNNHRQPQRDPTSIVRNDVTKDVI